MKNATREMEKIFKVIAIKTGFFFPSESGPHDLGSNIACPEFY